MKIHDVSGAGAAYSPQNSRKAGPKQVERSAPADRVTLSAEAREALSLRGKVDSAPNVRQEKIARLRKAIAEGTYHPDLREVANRLLKSGVLGDLS